jgi:hypothetical protein
MLLLASLVHPDFSAASRNLVSVPRSSPRAHRLRIEARKNPVFPRLLRYFFFGAFFLAFFLAMMCSSWVGLRVIRGE